MRVGIGYDVHRLVPNRKLILGGVMIPYKKGLLGHSDADVLTHAIADALLGAAGMKDIGFHFPDSDAAYENISSLYILSKTNAIVRDRGFIPCNVDATILAERPKLSQYRRHMEENIARVLNIDLNDVNIKATTTEGLGAIGNGEGIAAMCVVLIETTNHNPDKVVVEKE